MGGAVVSATPMDCFLLLGDSLVTLRSVGRPLCTVASTQDTGWMGLQSMRLLIRTRRRPYHLSHERIFPRQSATLSMGGWPVAFSRETPIPIPNETQKRACSVVQRSTVQNHDRTKKVCCMVCCSFQLLRSILGVLCMHLNTAPRAHSSPRACLLPIAYCLWCTAYGRTTVLDWTVLHHEVQYTTPLTPFLY